MAEERKPLIAFRMFRTVNGGWVIRPGIEDYGRSDGPGYAYTSDIDMLQALPVLIGTTYIVPRIDLPGVPVQAFRAVDPNEVEQR